MNNLGYIVAIIVVVVTFVQWFTAQRRAAIAPTENSIATRYEQVKGAANRRDPSALARMAAPESTKRMGDNKAAEREIVDDLNR